MRNLPIFLIHIIIFYNISPPLKLLYIVSNKLGMIKFSLALPEECFVYNTVKQVFSGGREGLRQGGFVIGNEIVANVGLPIHPDYQTHGISILNSGKDTSSLG